MNRLFVLALVIGFVSQHADAQDRASGLTAPLGNRSPVRLTLEAMTDLPVFVGGSARLELPFVDAFVSLGGVPDVYTSVYSQVARSYGASSSQAGLVRGIGNGGFVFQAGLALRPNPDEGAYVSAAYQMFSFRTDLDTTLVSDATGLNMAPTGMTALPVRLTLHALRAEVGYRWVFGDNWTLRLALGWVHTLSSTSQLEIDPALRARAASIVSAFENDLATGTSSYGFSPFVSLGIGFRI